MTNTVDSDQQAEPTDLDLHYLKHGSARQIQGNLQFLQTRHILFEITLCENQTDNQANYSKFEI